MGELHSPVRELCARLAQPFWMPAPASWHWRMPTGAPQTLFMEDEPGVTNLLWLAVDLLTPPAVYQLGKNDLAMTIVMFAPATMLDGGRLADAAAVLPLREFVDWLPSKPLTGNPLVQALPLIKLFAQRRLQHEQR